MRFAWFGSLAVLVALTAACKKKPSEAAKQEEAPKSEPSTPAPDDLVLELVVKDADDLALRAAKAAGFEKEAGADPYETLTKLRKVDASITRAIDPHGAAALVVLANADALAAAAPKGASDVESVINVVGAVHLKDAEAIQALVAALGKETPHPAKSFEGTIYPRGDKGGWAVAGDVGLVSDDLEVLERAGAYAAQLARRGKGEAHDVALRAPMAAWKGKASDALKRAWDEAKGAGDAPMRVVAAIDAHMPAILTALADVGDGSAYLDVKDGQLVIGGSLAAHGAMGAWLGGLASSSSAALLAAPKGLSVLSFHLPGGLADVVDAAIDDGVAAWTPGTASVTDAVAYSDVGKALHDLRPTVSDEGTISILRYEAGKTGEFVIGARLVDAAKAKAAAQHLGAALGVVWGKAFDVKPYAHGSGAGETWTLGAPSPTPASTVTWAIAGERLWIDLCHACVAGALDATIDGKGTLGDDATAKKTIGAMPSKDVFSASYVDWNGLASQLTGGASPSVPQTSEGSWGALLTRASGAEVEWSMPVDVLGAFARIGVNRYLMHSKTAEATRSLGAIETGMKVYAASVTPAKFPRSAPAVPKAIPAGVKVMSTSTDWSGSWADVKFVMTDPQYYQYEIVTAPDGQSAAIYARGDLDGDGVTSEFKLSMRIDPATHEAVRSSFTIVREDE